MVCYDLEFPEWVRLALLADAAILALPTNWPDGGLSTDPTPMEAVCAQAAVSQNKMVVAAADRTRDERGVRWSSANIIADSDGGMICEKIDDRNSTERSLGNSTLPNFSWPLEIKLIGN